MSQELPPAITSFRQMFSGSRTDISTYLADDVELRPPTYGKSWLGQPLVARLITFAAQEFGCLAYDKIWRDGESYVLRFEGQLDGKHLSGVDVVELNAVGEISLVEIFARPPSQMLQFPDRMALRIHHDPDVVSLMGLS